MPDRTILAFDTSAAHCAAALLSGDRVLGEMHERMLRGQAERLMGLLGGLLGDSGLSWRDLDLVGVGIGPGNFTGIRISVAAARGLALGLGVPAIGISTLDALALDTPEPVVTSVDARRGHVYVRPGAGAPILADRAALPPLPPKAICIGEGAEAIAVHCGGRQAAARHSLAVAIARLALRADPRTGPRPTPLYIRAADAAPAPSAPAVA